MEMHNKIEMHQERLVVLDKNNIILRLVHRKERVYTSEQYYYNIYILFYGISFSYLNYLIFN
jgi:hypothetical protein